MALLGAGGYLLYRAVKDGAPGLSWPELPELPAVTFSGLLGLLDISDVDFKGDPDPGISGLGLPLGETILSASEMAIVRGHKDPRRKGSSRRLGPPRDSDIEIISNIQAAVEKLTPVGPPRDTAAIIAAYTDPRRAGMI